MTPIKVTISSKKIKDSKIYHNYFWRRRFRTASRLLQLCRLVLGLRTLM